MQDASIKLPDAVDCTYNVGFGVQQAIKALCGTVKVPEDRSKPDGSKIALYYTILPPLNPNAKGLPIFHLEGGPGAPAVYSFGRAWFAAYDSMRQEHPVVIFDQRGTGLSSSLLCVEITQGTLYELRQITPPAEAKTDFAEKLAACHQRLLKNKRRDPALFTTIQAAEDLDAVRLALGYEQIYLFANSYGTTLAQAYLRRHGAYVAGAILDSPAAPWNHWQLDARNNAQAALNAIFALCKSDLACDAIYPNLPERLQTLLTRLAKAPANVSSYNEFTDKYHPVMIDDRRFMGVVRRLLYSTYEAVSIPMLIEDALDGDYDQIAYKMVNEALDGDNSGGIVSGLYYSVICSELVPFYTEELLAQYSQKTLFGDNYGSQNLIEYCKSWPVPPLPAADVAPLQSDRPVLILQGALDPITPPKFGEETHARLKNSTLAVFPYQAHGVLPGSVCAQGLAAAFLTNPTSPLDTTCTKDDLRPIFDGTYQLEFVPFTDKQATFNGLAPKGWDYEQDGVLTVFVSPDEYRHIALGNYPNTDFDVAKDDVFKRLIARMGRFYVTAHYERELSRLFTIYLPETGKLGFIALERNGEKIYARIYVCPGTWFSATWEAVVGKI
jgi:pimeloyl-ACP methyl ester carboxylesterase